MTRLHKHRITITLRPDLLPRLDTFVDGEKIRNRSHAIEYILSKHLGVDINTAAIFTGAANDTHVYALERVHNRPVISYILDMLHTYHVHNVILVTDQFGTELEQYVGDGSQWGLRLKTIKGQHSQGTAQALANIRSFVDDSFFLIYGDNLADINLSELVESHRQGSNIGTVALTYKRAPEDYGIARMEGNRIVEYLEKPGKEGKPGLVNAGIYIFEPTIFQYLHNSDKSIEHEILPRIAALGSLRGYPFQGTWLDMSKQWGRDRACEQWKL